MRRDRPDQDPFAIGVIALALLAGCAAEPAVGVAHDGGLTTPCSPFADLVVEYKRAGGASDLEAAAAALGAPDGEGATVAVDDVLTIAFVGLGAAIDGDGADL